MGLSIHYSGYIKHKDLITPLVEEVSDISQTLNWKHQTFDDDEISGISFAPQGSESVFLTFDINNRLLSPISILTKDIYDGVQFDKDLLFTASTKTQFAGPDAHIAIIKLLKYISGKYLSGFELMDEGNYWGTGDEKLLLNQFKIYEVALDSFCQLLEGLPPDRKSV